MPQTVKYTDPPRSRPDTYWNGGGNNTGSPATQRVSPATPMGLVGEYLPELEPGEVEIAMIGMHSSMGDVISVRAKQCGDKIEYRVVDEIQIGHGLDEPTIYEFAPRTSEAPLTYEELTDLLLHLRTDGRSIFRSQWDADAESRGWADERDGFFTLQSDFYEGLNDWLDKQYKEWRVYCDPNADDCENDGIHARLRNLKWARNRVPKPNQNSKLE